LARLEAGKAAKGESATLQLFDVGPVATPEPSAVEAALAHIDPDALSPRDAHALIYRLKKLAE
jgi:DNA mismatch repair protein MutS